MKVQWATDSKMKQVSILSMSRRTIKPLLFCAIGRGIQETGNL